ncbi:MAG: hypothetical protein ACRD1X_22155 [Vicinamibacteria bacterium]
MDEKRNGYQLVKEDILHTLALLGAQITHKSDGSTLGDKCWGFFVGAIYAHSRRWQSVRERQDEVGRLGGVVQRLTAAMKEAARKLTFGSRDVDSRLAEAVLIDALEREEAAFKRVARASSRSRARSAAAIEDGAVGRDSREPTERRAHVHGQ